MHKNFCEHQLGDMKSSIIFSKENLPLNGALKICSAWGDVMLQSRSQAPAVASKKFGARLA